MTLHLREQMRKLDPEGGHPFQLQTVHSLPLSICPTPLNVFRIPFLSKMCYWGDRCVSGARNGDNT